MFKSCFKKMIILVSVISLPFVTNSGSLYASENNFVGEKTQMLFLMNLCRKEHWNNRRP